MTLRCLYSQIPGKLLAESPGFQTAHHFNGRPSGNIAQFLDFMTRQLDDFPRLLGQVVPSAKLRSNPGRRVQRAFGFSQLVPNVLRFLGRAYLVQQPLHRGDIAGNLHDLARDGVGLAPEVGGLEPLAVCEGRHVLSTKRYAEIRAFRWCRPGESDEEAIFGGGLRIAQRDPIASAGTSSHSKYPTNQPLFTTTMIKEHGNGERHVDERSPLALFVYIDHRSLTISIVTYR